MSCWVVPTIAADLWGVPVQHVLSCIREGRVPSKVENGFIFVDVAPHSPTIAAPRRLAVNRPRTFVTVTPHEIAALTGAEDGSPDGDAAHPVGVDPAEEQLAAVGADSTEADSSLSGLDHVFLRRDEVARLRRAPGSLRAAYR